MIRWVLRENHAEGLRSKEVIILEPAELMARLPHLLCFHEPHEPGEQHFSFVVPNAADDRIVTEVERDRDPSSLTIVTSDRDLQARVSALGAGLESPKQLLSDLESASP